MNVPETTLDLAGIGFGPAAMAVAVALEDDDSPCPNLRARFLDRAPAAGWKPDMLLPGTDIQHHFLRDFATPRNPRSRFSFPSYLVDTDRFYHFTALNGYVTRNEWSRYVEWVAERLGTPVDRGTEVRHVLPVERDGAVVAAEVRTVEAGTGREQTWTASNVMVATGYTPSVPEPFRPHLGEDVFHSADYLTRIGPSGVGGHDRIAVIGAGQNAGEILLDLIGRSADVELHSLVRNSGFKMYELGHFSNEVYFPGETDYFYSLGPESRDWITRETMPTNFSAVDPDVSTALYRAVYDDLHWGRGRLHMTKRTEVVRCHRERDHYRLETREIHTGETGHVDVDAIVLCTGFDEPRIPPALEAFEPYIRRDERADPQLTRAFRLETTPECTVGLYSNGTTEWRHGINSAASFSTIALRGGLIAGDLAGRVGGRNEINATALENGARNGHDHAGVGSAAASG